MIKNAEEILIHEIDRAVESLKSCVTPIFDVNEDLEAELLGSAVLIEVGGEVFLCTAGHVIDGNACSTLYVDGPSKFEVLEGTFSRSGEYDVAVLKLTVQQRELLQKYAALPADRIAIPSEASHCKYASLVGFPETKNRKIYDQDKIKGQVYSLGGSIVDVQPGKVRVSFSRQRNVDSRTGQRVAAPNPHGMSGGAIFGTAVKARAIDGKPDSKLIGIVTDWPPPPAVEIFGPSMAIVMAIIRDEWKIALPARLTPAYLRTHSPS